MPDEPSRELNAEQAWRALLDKYNIVQEVKDRGIFHITASQIKEFKAPGTPLVVQWLRTHLPEQRTWVQSLVGEPRSHTPRDN